MRKGKKKYKIAVYAIAKNEASFVSRFVESAKEADEIVVLDTGSTDETVSLLKEKGVTVFEEVITPWRFDVARNRSLELVSEDVDICICLDLDEVLSPGWREDLEASWQENTTRGRYLYHWKIDEKGKSIIRFYCDKIHSRHGYKWTHPVHEVLKQEGNKEEAFVSCPGLEIRHYPDPNKSRSSYLPLLELSVEEDPFNDRNMHYLGREYMYYGKWDQAIETLHRHLSLPRATWKDERCASMRFIARCYLEKGFLEEAELWYQKATKEAPYLKDGFMELALLYYQQHRYLELVTVLRQAEALPENGYTYINEPFTTDGTLEDLLSIGLYYIGNKKEALEYAKKALSKREDKKRIQANIERIEKELREEGN